MIHSRVIWYLLLCGLVYYSPIESRAGKKRTVLATQEAKNLLDDVYAGVNAFSISDQEREIFKQKKSESTYGEITLDALEQLVDLLKPTAHDIFYDLGSGKGQAPLYMAVRTPMRKCVGVELAWTRHNYALDAKKKLDARGALHGCNVVLLQADFTDPSVDLHDATIVWMNSTCYPQEVMDRIVQRLAKLKPGLRVITLKSLPNPEKYGFKLIKEMQLPMTWSNSVTAHMYVLEKQSKK